MKTKTIIEEITHDDLVTLLADSTYGSQWLSISSDARDLRDDGDCREDIWAKALLAGRSIEVYDYYAEGCVYGNLPHTIEDDGEVVHYTVTLEDVKSGLTRCIDGGDPYTMKCINDLMSDSSDWDICEAEAVMQVIVFGEVIYG